MRRIFGALLILMGVAAGIYFGVVWALVGGIVLAIHAFSANPINAGDAAWGLVRALGLWEVIGVVAFWALALPGVRLLAPKRRKPGVTVGGWQSEDLLNQALRDFQHPLNRRRP